MARRRDTRIFGPGPYVLGLRREGGWGSGFPFDVPAVAVVEEVKLDRPVTLLAGENGSGKSTILEAVAEAIGFAEQGGELDRVGELPAVPHNVLGGALAPMLTGSKPRNGYYLRAESFFNIAGVIDRDDRVSIYGDVPMHQQSHGESFLSLAANRFGRDPARLPQCPHLRVRRHRRHDPGLRRPAGGEPHTRLPRRAGALPEGTRLRRAGGRRLIARTRPAAGRAARGPCRQRE